MSYSHFYATAAQDEKSNQVRTDTIFNLTVIFYSHQGLQLSIYFT